MKFLFEYNTRENVRQSGEIFAADRDAAFRELRARGVKPYKMVEAPGLCNKIFGKGKRWLAICALATICVLLALILGLSKGRSPTVGSPMPRHQIYGDPALMDDLAKSDYEFVFTNKGDRVLARFACPGIYVKNVAGAERDSMVNALAELSSKDEPIVDSSDIREIAELKRIVKGMRLELRRYLSIGSGTPESYLRRLYERQNRELQIYNQACAELKSEKDILKFERINQSLRNLGLKTILMSSPDIEGPQ